MRATKPQIIICMISICIFLYHMGSWKCNVFITFKHEVTQFIHFTLKRSIYSRKCLLLFSNFSRICPSYPFQWNLYMQQKNFSCEKMISLDKIPKPVAIGWMISLWTIKWVELIFSEPPHAVGGRIWNI